MTDRVTCPFAPPFACCFGVCSSLASSHCLQRRLLHCHLQLQCATLVQAWALHFTPWLWLSHLFFFCVHSPPLPSSACPTYPHAREPRSIKSINIFTSQNIWANFRALRWGGMRITFTPGFAPLWLCFSRLLFSFNCGWPKFATLMCAQASSSCYSNLSASSFNWFKFVHRARGRKEQRLRVNKRPCGMFSTLKAAASSRGLGR